MRNYQVQGNLFKQESRLCEFLIIVPLPKQIEDQVRIYKEEFEVLFGGYRSRHSIAHITVCNFLLFEHRTFDTFELFRNRLKETPSFELNTYRFSSFPESKTIYLNVEKSNSYIQLLNIIDFTRKLLYLRRNYFQSNVPHITIAKNLKHEVFKKGVEIFSERTFTSRFEVSSLKVLQYNLINRRYTQFGTIPLKVH